MNHFLFIIRLHLLGRSLDLSGGTLQWQMVSGMTSKLPHDRHISESSRLYVERIVDLQRTLAASVKDDQTTNEQRKQIVHLPEGSSLFDSICHRDERGSVTELYDPRWAWHQEPLVFSYLFTIRPGMIKGWGLHKLHEDRYFVVRGEMEVVMYDPRPESSTFGKISKICLSAARPQLLNVPRNVWHADRNLGTEDLMVVNFPTIQYDHNNPDKYRLPLDTDQIPYSFAKNIGW